MILSIYILYSGLLNKMGITYFLPDLRRRGCLKRELTTQQCRARSVGTVYDLTACAMKKRVSPLSKETSNAKSMRQITSFGRYERGSTVSVNGNCHLPTTRKPIFLYISALIPSIICSFNNLLLFIFLLNHV